MKKKVVILVSGSGSNMEALIKSSLHTSSLFQITAVISNKKDVKALQIAHQYNLTTYSFDLKDCDTRKKQETLILNQLEKLSPDWICLAGYMQILSVDFIRKFSGRILNIHPSLLPLFPGLNVHEQVKKSGMRVSGCTVHIVTEELDAGPIVGQAVVPVFETDTPTDIQKRTLIAEHKLYSLALKKCLTGEPYLGCEKNFLIIT